MELQKAWGNWGLTEQSLFMYQQCWLFEVVMLSKVTMNTKLVNTEPLLLGEIQG